MAYIGQEPGQGQAERFIFTASGNETAVTTADDGRLIGYTVGQVSVYLNGVKLALGTDFTATNGSTITLIGNSPALSASDVVEVIALSAFSPSDTVSASSGGTFSGAVTASAGFTANTADINGGTIDGSTITSPVINTGVSGTAVLDSDTMSGASATTISSSESIKAYVDSAGTNSSITTLGTVTSGTLNATVAGSPPSWGVIGTGQAASTDWPPHPLDINAVSGNYFVSTGVTLNSTSNYITVTYSGTYWIFVDVNHDVGGSAASAIENIVFLYIKTGSFVNTGTYTIALDIGGSGGTRSNDNGHLRTTSGMTVNLDAGSHLWVGAYTSPAVTTTLKNFSGVLIR